MKPGVEYSDGEVTVYHSLSVVQEESDSDLLGEIPAKCGYPTCIPGISSSLSSSPYFNERKYSREKPQTSRYSKKKTPKLKVRYGPRSQELAKSYTLNEKNLSGLSLRSYSQSETSNDGEQVYRERSSLKHHLTGVR